MCHGITRQSTMPMMKKALSTGISDADSALTMERIALSRLRVRVLRQSLLARRHIKADGIPTRFSLASLPRQRSGRICWLSSPFHIDRLVGE